VPWKAKTPVEERLQFLARLRDGERLVDLCREFEISRKTGSKFKKRFEELGLNGLLDQRRAPKTIPHRTPDEIVKLILALRRLRSTWGPKKLHEALKRKHPKIHIPAPSTIADILNRNGVEMNRRIRKHKNVSTPFPELSAPTAPNDVWCIDYKGQFRLGNQKYCFPLTVTDAASRYILACEGFERISGDDARRVLEHLFNTVGLPRAMRYDGGPPFASPTSLARISRLSAWWVSLGIKLEQIEPASPQQNGRHERMHRTLKAETTRPASKNLLGQQARFDAFVETFNYERPHEALAMKCPADVFVPSTRIAKPLSTDYPLHDHALKVQHNGTIRLPRGFSGDPVYFISECLFGHTLGVRELDGDRWLVSLQQIDLGWVDRKTKRFEPKDA
jgi:putative transposase